MPIKQLFRSRKKLDSSIDSIWSAHESRAVVKDFACLLAVMGVPIALGYYYMAGFALRNSLGIFMSVLGVLTLVLMRIGNTRLAVSFIIWGFWGLLCTWGGLVLGVRTPVLAVIPALILLNGWLFGKSSAMLMGLLSALVLSLLLWLELSGFLVVISRRSIDYYIAYMATCLTAGYFAGHIGKSFHRQFKRLQETGRSLGIQLEALRFSEERFSLLFRTNPLPLMMTRASDGTIFEVNAAWEQVFGWPVDEVRGKTTREIGLCAASDLYERIPGRDGEEAGQAGTLEFIHRDGTVRSYLISLAQIEIEGERRHIASLLDQTERLKAEEAVRQLNASLEAQVAQRTAALSQALEHLKTAQAELLQSEKLASLGALVAGISHELNTPIGNALTVASTLQEKSRQFNRLTVAGELRKSALLDFLAGTEEMSDLIYRSCQRSADLIQSFKQIAVDQTTEHRRQFDLRTLVDDVLATLRPSYKNAPWIVRVEVPAGMVCDSYPGPLAQILTNLVQNAFIHAFEGREAGEVLIEAQLIGRKVRLAVRDNGKGMDFAVRKRIFDPFFTTRMGQGGTGLGLSISHQIATAVLRGSLKVISRKGLGASFLLTFPQEVQENPGTPENSP